MNSQNDLRDAMRDDERRRRDEVRVATLQSQIDELRSLVRELTSRQVRNEDHFKNYEAGLAELRAALDQQRYEAGQRTQVRQLEETRVREQLGALDERIDELNKPIRSLQSQVAEAIEALRRVRDEDRQEDRRYHELRTVLDDIATHAERNSDNIKAVRDLIESVKTDHAQTQRDLIKTDDSVRIVEQDARRRVSEIQQAIQVVESRIDAFKPRFDQIDALIEDTRDSIQHIDPTFEELRAVDQSLETELQRVYTNSVERDDLHGERIDELRVQLDTSNRDLRQAIEAYYERLNERIDGVADRVRELGYRLSVIEMKLDELVEADSRIRREVWHLHEMRTRSRLDQIQTELEEVIASRREFEEQIASDQGDSGSGQDGGVD